ncbi:helix-turn-helix transcriptional regulator [Ktedonobacter robiniae]|uniref:HTH cro/C1-type domain-containing protein n=1 Tax=Ktedonobacter robiniae TaxID=2778365 RepID=A0ABQ3UWX4_9CHLR|nr:helix-turn-helix transcriptional regulator [Ktedonobacter robiniae]GHO57268.1 hypothetical protein KSB_57430 [Ktedonobacter robiniae]
MKSAKAVPNHVLRRERELRGWSQGYVAEQIHAPAPSYIYRWEKGLAFPSPYYRERLCTLFQKDAQELGFLDIPIPTPPSLVLMPSSPEHERSVAIQPWFLPYQRNPFFTGREALLSDLYDTFFKRKGSSLSYIQAITGLGGMGKTQAAVEYAYCYRDAYNAVLWLQAETHNDLNSSCMALNDLLRPPHYRGGQEEDAIGLFKLWLQRHENWLVILDNVEDFSLLQAILPTQPLGHVLLTTRTQFTGCFAHCVHLEKLGNVEGALMLLRRAKHIDREELPEQAALSRYPLALELAAFLDGLPLALDQAGAYIEETGCSLEEYLAHYRVQSPELLARRGLSSVDHPNSVEATFALAFERLEQQHPLAAELLHLCAFFHPHAIPQEFLLEASSLQPGLQPLADNPRLLDEVLVSLRASSLVKRNGSTQTFAMHSLVQTVLRNRATVNQQCQLAELVVTIVGRLFPDPEDIQNWELCQRYLHQALNCTLYIEQWNMASSETANLLSRIATYVWKHASCNLAEKLLKQLLVMRRQLEEPLAEAECLNNLAVLYQYQRRFRQAELLHLCALAMREQVLGSEHLEVVESLLNLGALYIEQERVSLAEPLCLRALHICEQLPDPMAPELARALNFTGRLYGLQGKYKEGEVLFKRVLKIRERKLGKKHPLVALALHDLARLYVRAGQLYKGERLFQQSLTTYEQALGAGNPYVAQVLKNYASLLCTMGRNDEAAKLQRRALGIQATHEQGEALRASK